MTPTNWKGIEFNDDSWKQFKEIYQKAVDNDKEGFVWKDHNGEKHNFLTAFAEYFIEFNDPKFNT